ncbi:hypothetical protein N7539_005178 [Penicillium diatomitis]|uniref:DUF1993 domain-containing protein n=1 Tax=Penicillium diatomitis TaxID=2819901 RepID=A0A9X0BV23_9EURO|nr:uncharacterized protein N7539_005178 [Penicillium diatomitis]KAJ5485190.1 hypothetical protein N7539_005178 [Penicillium diatomitis]
MTTPYTFHTGSVKIAHNLLQSLSHILHKASNADNGASPTKPDTTTLLNARLIQDMYPLSDQIRLATQYTEFIVARTTNRDPLTYSSPTTFAQAHEMIDAVVSAAAAADPETVNQQADVVKMSMLGKDSMAEMRTAEYVHLALLPNLYFHVTTAYGILRKEGVKLEKWDYYAGFVADLNQAKESASAKSA